MLFISLTMQSVLFAGVDFRRINGVYEVQTTPDEQARAEGEEVFQDQLTVKDINVSFLKWGQRGFDPGHCGFAQGRDFTFRCSSYSGEGQLLWIGVFGLDSVSGALVWSKYNGEVLKYTFSGHKQTAK